MSPRKLTAKERIAKALRGLDLGKLKQGTAKRDNILIRVSVTEKAEIKTVAAELGLSVSEYLLTLHRQLRDRQ